MSLKPLADKVVVKIDETQEKTVNGILLLPQAQKDTHKVGKVVATGPGKINDKGILIEMSVKPGDQVLLNKTSGIETIVDGEKYYIFQETEILGILES